MDKLHKHIDIIQNNISRMSQNSFLIKGWTVTLLTALFALCINNCNRTIILVALLPVILFWFLDAFFLLQEKKFRALYKDVIAEDNEPKIKNYEIPIDNYYSTKTDYVKVFFSKTIFPFYLVMILLCVICFLVMEV